MTELLASRYELLEKLDEHVPGSVFRALDRELDRLVLLRILPAFLFAGEDDRLRCLRDAEAIASLDHPNICSLYEAGGTGDGGLFQALAFCEGETLARRLERGPLRPAVAIDLGAQVAAGLGRAHSRGVVHGCLSPSSIMVTPSGEVRILDFGWPRLNERTHRGGDADAPLSTLAYPAPEQMRGAPPDPSTDLWAVGGLLYEMTTGLRPAPAATPAPLRSLRPEVPEGLERIVRRAMAVERRDRYAEVELLLHDLRLLVGSGGRPSGPTPAAAPPKAGFPDPGTIPARVGHYRLIEPLGGGGMGVVYKAEDTRLGRPVALKFLPPELARDPLAKARFAQEARAASALEHPNLCTIHDLGETEDRRLYLVMPCYDGATLRERLQEGGLPIAEAVDIARQIALGLAKAHRQGIVHRDIKPSNLIVTSDGVVKILDFGIAKLAGEAGLTRTGALIGTPAYMSPEQARGEEADHRADLWALGVVLYEMLAGRRPFRGDHEAAVVDAILRRDPEPLSRWRPDAPPPLEKLITQLLARSPADRPAGTDAVAAELRRLAGASTEETVPPRLPEGGSFRRRPLRVWAGGALGLVVAVVGVWSWRGTGAPAPGPARPTFERLTFQSGQELFPSLSPDGSFFVYAKRSPATGLDIYLQRIGGGNPINLTPDSAGDDTHPAFSPDGTGIAFRSDRDGGGIFLMGATGESVRRLSDFGHHPSWSPDGREIVVSTEETFDPSVRRTDSRIWRIEVATGRRKLVTTLDARLPSWSPDGGRIAFSSQPAGLGRRSLWIILLESGKPQQVTDGTFFDWDPVWSRDGRFLYFSSDRSGSMNLWRVAIDERTGKAQAPPEAIGTPSEWSAFPSFASDGRRFLYTTRTGSRNLEKVSFDPERLAPRGDFVPVTQGPRVVRSASPSPDGRWLVFDIAAPQEDLFIASVNGSEVRQITDDRFNDRIPNWSPDGSRILFYSDRGGFYEAWTIRPDGSGLTRIGPFPEPALQPIWSPDGRHIAVTFASSGAALVEPGPPSRVLRPLLARSEKPGFFPFSWSSDGTRISGGAEGIFVRDLATLRLERLTRSGAWSIWLKNGKTLLFRDRGRVLAIDVATRKIRPVLDPPPNHEFRAFSLSADERTLYLVRETFEGDVWMVSFEERPE